MWVLLLLWPLALGFSLGDTQTPISYEEVGSAAEGGGEDLACLGEGGRPEPAKSRERQRTGVGVFQPSLDPCRSWGVCV